MECSSKNSPKFDSTVAFGRDHTLLMCPIDHDPAFMFFDSQLRNAGRQWLLSWDFCMDEGGVPGLLSVPLAAAFLKLGSATFSFPVPSDTPVMESVGDTHVWTVRTPLSHRLRCWIWGDRWPNARDIHIACTRRLEVLAEEIGWSAQYQGRLIITRESLDERTWDWQEQKEFSTGIVDDRSGAILRRDPLVLVIPGTDADFLWLCCKPDSVDPLQKSLRESCENSNLRFRVVSYDELCNRFSYLPEVPAEYRKFF